ncbi:MAG: glycosyltransferase [Chloroflexota bacterium]|nr:glycosyltransferase [Chloroflexota bacterium]
MTIGEHQPAGANAPGTREAQEHSAAPLLFSIIICTYNRCNMVLSTLASLRRQTLPYTYFEVIVVDNGSSDDSLQKIRTYVNASTTQERAAEHTWQVSCLKEPRNGLAYARNKGLQAARGEIAIFLDDDTLAIPSFLTNLLHAYEATGADAIGGRVELRWEAARPYWLTDDLLAMLGYFAPSLSRMPLPEELSFSTSNFSAKIEALRKVGPFSPFLSKRLHAPARVEGAELCLRLRAAGYSLWYEPGAAVVHRVPAARLQRAFFQGRAYWEGRSEAMLAYVTNGLDGANGLLVTLHLLAMLLCELFELLHIALLHRPLLYLAARSTNERLQAAMAQAHIWGYLRHQVQFIEHAPTLLTTPAVLFVHPGEERAFPLLKGLLRQEQHCTTAAIPLLWLWRHRTYQAQAVGIIHLYQAGAFDLKYWQRQHFWLRIWLAQCLGVRIVTSDVGGWWQDTHNLRFLSQRAFERRLLLCSDIVLSYARQNVQLYPDKQLRRRVRFLTHPGYRGYYQLIAREQANRQLGLPLRSAFVYLCFAQMHTEREVTHLIAAFADAEQQQMRKPESSSHKKLQLLLVGSPADRQPARQVLKQAALNSAIHLFPECYAQDLSLYLGAAHVVVLPHFAYPQAGVLATALLALSCERVVVAPDLPRFQGVLPSSASILYDAASRSSLVQALVKAQSSRYHLREKDCRALDATTGWQTHTERLLEIYRYLLESFA